MIYKLYILVRIFDYSYMHHVVTILLLHTCICNVAALDIAALLTTISTATTTDAIRDAMTQLDDLIAAYTSVDQTELLDACQWYHDYVGLTLDDGTCYNRASYVDLDCDHIVEYMTKLEVITWYTYCAAAAGHR